MGKEHTGLPVAGYRPQPAEKVAFVNAMKETEERMLRALDAMRDLPAGTVDLLWLAIGRTAIEQGFMAVNRSIFQPSRVVLDGDAS